MASHAEIMAQSLLQILQCRILLIFLMIDPGQQKVGISRTWIQTQALMQDAGGCINLIESHLRFRQQHLNRERYNQKAQGCRDILLSPTR